MLLEATHIKPSKGFFSDNRQRLVQALRSKIQCTEKSVILLRGADLEYIYDDDQQYEFHQDNKFWWATGVDQEGAYAVINTQTGKLSIYIPKAEEMRKFWERILELEEYFDLYQIDEAKYLEGLESDLVEQGVDKIFILGGGVNKYSGVGPLAPDFPWFSKFFINSTALYPTFNEVQLHKSPEEITLLREAARIGSLAHIFILQSVKPGINESHIQTLMRFYCGVHGPTVKVPYEEICASGKNAAVLHYSMNDTRIQDGQVVLLDAGSKINGYNSDITSTFPINGKFTEKQAKIYNIVLKAHNDIRAAAKPGVHWQDLQNLAERVIIQGLLDLGLVKEGTVEELWNKRISYYFFPHGIGHHIGTYVHDLLGDPALENEKRVIPNQNLRFHRRLEETMTVTNEPGIYFIDLLIKKAKNDEQISGHFNFDLIEEYSREIQGVRIEDMMVIHSDRAEGLTHLPRTVEQIEKCMAKQNWE